MYVVTEDAYFKSTYHFQQLPVVQKNMAMELFAFYIPGCCIVHIMLSWTLTVRLNQSQKPLWKWHYLTAPYQNWLATKYLLFLRYSSSIVWCHVWALRWNYWPRRRALLHCGQWSARRNRLPSLTWEPWTYMHIPVCLKTCIVGDKRLIFCFLFTIVEFQWVLCLLHRTVCDNAYLCNECGETIFLIFRVNFSGRGDFVCHPPLVSFY